MSKYNYFRQGFLCPDEEQRLLTKQFYNNAFEIYARFNDWKDDDRFYFIPLYMRMTYSVQGMVLEMAPDPVWMGSFVRCSLEHPELFQITCPRCKRKVFPYHCVGSPLSGRVDLTYRCKCGKKGYVVVSGWQIRADALRDQVEMDKVRNCEFMQENLGGDQTADINELMSFLSKERIPQSG